MSLQHSPLEQLLDELESALTHERSALETRDLARMSTISADKARLFSRLETVAANQDPTSKADFDHTLLSQRLRHLHDLNLVNGTIIARSQQFTREMIHLLTGHTPNGLYGASGQPTVEQQVGQNLGEV